MFDGEGVKHVIRLSVEQAKNREEARQVAQTVAHSLLVKTAWAGADPNWGRILAAVGRSGVAVDPAQVSIQIGDQMVCRNGMGCAFDESGRIRPWPSRAARFASCWVEAAPPSGF